MLGSKGHYYDPSNPYYILSQFADDDESQRESRQDSFYKREVLDDSYWSDDDERDRLDYGRLSVLEL